MITSTQVYGQNQFDATCFYDITAAAAAIDFTIVEFKLF